METGERTIEKEGLLIAVAVVVAVVVAVAVVAVAAAVVVIASKEYEARCAERTLPIAATVERRP